MSETQGMSPQYVRHGKEDGPHYGDNVCLRCGKKLKERVPLEFDQRVNEYHDFGGVPESKSQGWFDFGPDCAAILRARARTALLRAGSGT